MLLHEKKVFVGTFVPRKEREKEMGEKVLLYSLTLDLVMHYADIDD